MTSRGLNADPMIAINMLANPESVGMVRGQVRAALEFSGLADYADDAELIASELVSNAVRHGSSGPDDKVTVALSRIPGGPGVALIVVDTSPEAPILKEFTFDEEGGRGMAIVDALASSWDWRPEGPGKAVFAFLSSEPPATAEETAGEAAPDITGGTADEAQAD